MFNYFERGLYLPNKWGTGDIDVTYLIGLNCARREGNLLYSATKEMADDPAMRNAFLMGYGRTWQANTADALSSFLNDYENPEFDGGMDESCQAILDWVKNDQSMRQQYEDAVNMERPYLTRGPVTNMSDYDVLENFFKGKMGQDTAKGFVDDIKSHSQEKGEGE